MDRRDVDENELPTWQSGASTSPVARSPAWNGQDADGPATDALTGVKTPAAFGRVERRTQCRLPAVLSDDATCTSPGRTVRTIRAGSPCARRDTAPYGGRSVVTSGRGVMEGCGPVLPDGGRTRRQR